MRDELCNGFFQHINSDGSYHSESDFDYPDEMTNENQKKYIKLYIGAIGNEENQENVDAFTLANVQNYTSAQRVKNTFKKTEYDLNVWKRFFRKISENREIGDITVTNLISGFAVL